MKILEIIKDYFAPAYSTRFANPSQDAKILSALGKEAVYLTASNGRGYLYYFPYKQKDINIAQYLMRRNGVGAYKHMTTYHYVREQVLRVPVGVIKANPNIKKFLDDINVSGSCKDFGGSEIFDEKLNLVRRQMQGKVR